MATEKRLIDAIAYCKELYAERDYPGRSGEFISAMEVAIADLGDMPTEDAVEVVHGHWEKTIDNCTVMHKCSVCGARVVKGFYEYENPNRYCYHCGAKMDGDGNG